MMNSVTKLLTGRKTTARLNEAADGPGVPRSRLYPPQPEGGGGNTNYWDKAIEVLPRGSCARGCAVASYSRTGSVWHSSSNYRSPARPPHFP